MQSASDAKLPSPLLSRSKARHKSDWVGPPPPGQSIEQKTGQHGRREDAIDKGDSCLGRQDGILEYLADAGLSGGKTKQGDASSGCPCDAQRTVPGMKSDHQDDGALDSKVDRECHEGDTNQAHCSAAPLVGESPEFPNNDGARSNFDKRVEPETTESNRARGESSKRQHDDTHDVPDQRQALKQLPGSKRSKGTDHFRRTSGVFSPPVFPIART
jgi:hypothetical protein